MRNYADPNLPDVGWTAWQLRFKQVAQLLVGATASDVGIEIIVQNRDSVSVGDAYDTPGQYVCQR